MARPPLVTVCVPTRNRAGFLRESLPTILAQDYEPLEILISDNGSTDDTEPLCREIAGRDPRVRYVRHEADLGLYGNHNFCLDESQGDYVCLWHDDDIRVPTLVRRYVEFLATHPAVGIVSSDYALIDDNGVVIGVRDRRVNDVTPGLEYISRTFASGQSSVGCPGAMIRQSALGRWRFSEDGPIGFADFVLWCQIAERADVGHIRERLWTYRLHRQSLSRRKMWDSVRDYEYHLGRYCQAHLARYPEHVALVQHWRRSLDAFLFWALAYEIGLHLDSRRPTLARSYRTVFEIADYQLDAAEVRAVLDLMRGYRRGVVQRAALLTIAGLLRIHVTRPLRWAADHLAWWRSRGDAR
jgi:glycosyltransferase involved in cell wall biosynthesis